ncbi:MAG: hypothetical protein K0R51_472 [Cytophagaceae bacterium]|jgi:hypothetical protein|nr:hypothetical protein [Cytophagaceae bacterium]
MASSLTLSHSITGPISDVYYALLHFKEFGQLHPHMKFVETVDHKENAIEYHVQEQLNLWGILPMKPCYRATVIEVEKDKHIRYQSEVKKGLFLTIDFTFATTDQQNNHTQISEHIILEGLPWIHIIFLSLLKKSHQQVFKNLQAKIISHSSN